MSNLWYGSTKQGGERSSKTLAKIDTQGRSTERSGKLSSFNTKISVLKISQNRTTARPPPTNGRPWRRYTTSSPTTTRISTTGRHTARSFRRYLQCRTGTTGSNWFSTTSGFGKRSASKPFHNEGSSNCTTRRKMLRFHRRKPQSQARHESTIPTLQRVGASRAGTQLPIILRTSSNLQARI